MENFKYYSDYKVYENGVIVSLKNNREKVIKPEMTNNGYNRVTLCTNGETKRFLLHRLVATLFIENHHNKPFVNHKNEIKNDNRVENLEWVTASENMIHAADNKLINVGSKSYNNKLVESDVVNIRNWHNSGALRKIDLARIFKVDKSLITRIINKKTWRNVI